ncbi:MAG: hypothetical protein GW913_02065 [Myxococcales bacterium]|nr:hypothetical protein [Myxococcales bacterium]
MAIEYNTDGPVEIAPGVYHLGVADSEHGWANIPYLVVEGEHAALIDPGSAGPSSSSPCCAR